MFSEVPSRRITERRNEIKSACWAALGIASEIAGWERHHRLGWEMVTASVVLVLSILSYLNKGHDDPWDPPCEDSHGRS
jgi:hypothetical protein